MLSTPAVLAEHSGDAAFRTENLIHLHTQGIPKDHLKLPESLAEVQSLSLLLFKKPFFCITWEVKSFNPLVVY